MADARFRRWRSTVAYGPCRKPSGSRRDVRLQARVRPAGPGRRRARPPLDRCRKRPGLVQPIHLRRPGVQGRRHRLRQRFSEPRFGAPSPRTTRGRPPRLTSSWAAFDPQQAAAGHKHRSARRSGALPKAFGRKSALEFSILRQRAQVYRPWSTRCNSRARCARFWKPRRRHWGGLRVTRLEPRANG